MASAATPSMFATPPAKRGERVLVAISVIIGLLLVIAAYSPRFTSRPAEFHPGEATNYRVDLNRADRSELMQVPGIGPGKADAIIALRQSVGGFSTPDDLQGVKGIGSKTLEKIKPHVIVDGSTVLPDSPIAPAPITIVKLKPGDPPLELNDANEADFQRIPGIGPTLAGRIFAAKPFASVDDLRRVKGIGAKTLESIRPFVKVTSK